MNITGIAVIPPKAAENNPKATPELMASCLAKYSRSNHGIEHIFSTIDPNDPDGAVDRIFKFIDYGHASIGGLTGGIAITVDNISMYMAYKIFEIAQLCDGQESSTRYIKLNTESLLTAEEAGIPDNLKEEWSSVMSEAFDLYQKYYEQLDEMAIHNPELLRIPKDLPEKVQTRLRKNYALDRSRYLIPMATKTGAAYIMTARIWAQTLKELDSLDLPEAKEAVKLIRSELEKFAPRLIRHSFADDATKAQAKQLVNLSLNKINNDGVSIKNIEDKVFISIENSFPEFIPASGDIASNFEGKKNRYSQMGLDVRRSFVRAAWNNIALAELRDLNRHRSGCRFSTMSPVGFYLPEELAKEDLSAFLEKYKNLVEKLAESGNGIHYYGYLLGTQTEFEHSSHLDKFIYEVELRTGLGAHFRYAEHLQKASEEFCKLMPEYKDFIEIGTAEPE